MCSAKHQMYLYHSSRTGACIVVKAHTHVACTAVTGDQMCPQPSFKAMQQCLLQAYQSDNIFILPRLRCGKHEHH